MANKIDDCERHAMAGLYRELDKEEAARAMLAALKRIAIVIDGMGWHRHADDAVSEVNAAIAAAESAGIGAK